MIQFIKKNRKYFFYASSIVISRGLEYFVLFFSAYYLSKDSYGQLEFYKKIIELIGVILAFGLPSLLLTYTRSKNSKIYLTGLSLLFIILLSTFLLPVLLFFGYHYLMIPVFFHAIFLNNGVLPVFFLTNNGSNQASLYKLITSILFYTGVFLLIRFHPDPEYAFIYINYFLILIGVIFLGQIIRGYSFTRHFFKRYYRLFVRLLASSLTLVFSNIANIMFLYTDILIIKIMSKSANLDIADYSFSLNIANILILIPFTLVQVDIEEIKKHFKLKRKAQRIFKLVLIFSFMLFSTYLLLTKLVFTNFSGALIVFSLILLAKISQTQSVLLGTLLLVQKKFKLNLKINLSMLVLNLILSLLFYKSFGVLGIALSSFISLTTRLFLLNHFSNFNRYD